MATEAIGEQRDDPQRSPTRRGVFRTDRSSRAGHDLRTAGPSLLILLALVLVPLLALAPFIPPQVAPATAPAAAFSAERALPHLQVIARQPHPVGSPADAQVRDYLLQQLIALGFTPEIQQADVLSGQFGAMAHVENILVRLPGADSTRAVLITAHYDSVVSGPGTGDDGVSVAAMLETLRALRAGPALRNDLIFLFNDGEEPGLLGTLAFVQNHPWAKDVGVAFDFDADSPATARTTLLWTTKDDGWLVREIGRSAAGMVASSVSTVDKRVDAGNDLRMFAAAGITGAHLNVVAGSTRYHNPNDSLANLDQRRLQDYGNAMLALARHFGDLPIADTRAANAVYFTVFGTTILHYPVGWALPLELLAALGLVALVAFGLWRRRLTVRGLLIGLLLVTLGLLVLGGLAQLGWLALRSAHPESGVFAEHDFYGRSLFMSSLYAGTAAVALAVVPWLNRRFSASHLVVASAAWLVAVVLLAGLDPSQSYFGLLPLLAGVLVLGVLLLVPGGQGSGWSSARLVTLLLGVVVILGLATSLFYRAAVDGLEAGPLLPIALLTLFLGLLAPQLALVGQIGRRWLPALGGIVAVGLLAVMLVTSGQSAANPRPNSLVYVLNADSGQALWVSADASPDAWTRQVLSASPRHQTLDNLYPGAGADPILTNSAPAASIAGPDLRLLAEERSGETRTLRLRLRSPRQAYRAYLLPGPGVELLAAGIGDKPLVALDQQSLRYDGLPAAGADLTLRVRANGPVTFTVIDESSGLPELPGVTLSARPARFIGAPGPEWVQGDPTLVWRAVEFQ
ncbi:MAG TPA: M28 family peptidase [Nitrolancea sp.]|nr:M28 family peptidase [Nitrolancea sp.]